MFTPRLAVASLSGESDAAWARRAADYAGCAFLGGVSIDDATRSASRELIQRDREEFLPGDPERFVQEQLRALADVPIRPAVNVRSATLVPLEDVADLCREYGAILEINAHCRQDEICAAGSGEHLLRKPGKLCKQVEAATATGATVSVKVRAEVEGVDLADLANRLARAGAAAIHVDAMDSESVVADVVMAANLFVVANNGVRGLASAREYFEYGADAVSVGRPSDDPEILRRVHEATRVCREEDAST
jgi:TIM-barrel protein